MEDDTKKIMEELEDFWKRGSVGGEDMGEEGWEDNFKLCDEHRDFFVIGCPRCEKCCEHWYGKGVKRAEEDGDLDIVVDYYDQRERKWRRRRIRVDHSIFPPDMGEVVEAYGGKDEE